jgi:hypothetical protein
MKKCPKCGAVLDDSKVKCYMCGTDLQRQTLTNGNSFNENIGATVSSSQGNVFSNNNQINNNVNTPNNVGGSTTFFSNANFSNSVYNNQLNNLNSMAYDDRTALEKMFSSDERFKSKAEINAQRAMKENQRRNNFVDAFNTSMSAGDMAARQPRRRPNQQQQQGQMPPNRPQQGMMPQQPMQNTQQMPRQPMMNQPMQNTQQNPQQPMNPNGQNQKKDGLFDKFKKGLKGGNNKSLPVPPEAVDGKKKPAINWGNDLSNGDNKNEKSGFSVSPSMIFNIIALVVSIIVVLVVYFKFVKSDEDGKVHTLANLKYSIGTNFKVKDKKNNAILYSYGEFCSISVSTGATNAVDSFVDDFYDDLKVKYEAEELNVSKSTAKYNNDVWTEINIIGISANAASANGYSSQTKIQYVAIVKDGNYYTIAYQNTNNNTICSASYDSFLHSLKFK